MNKNLKASTIPKVEKAKALFDKGESLENIAAGMECSVRTVRRLLIAAGVKFVQGAPKKLLDSDIETVYEKLTLRETTLDAVAAEFGVTVNTVRARVKEYVDRDKLRKAQRLADEIRRKSN